MRLSFLFIFLLSFTIVSSQEINQEVHTKQGHRFLVGPINLEGLQSKQYKNWFKASYDSYQTDNTLVEIIQKKIKNYHIKLFLGTWCGDSKREVPRMIKILERANFPMENLELIALDRRKGYYKKSPNGEEKGWNILKIPTMIFLKNDKEVNRIVESPINSLEEDILAIISGETYKPNYSTK
ncbi:hypothetical protein MTsPCn9_20570 [Croceitalea sp. MTPC9]|uniref:thioredoxin family protein n=1 Tax=unclassified Croceitalea TaxID=2632280 RepID=UPI002B380C89|nr:hypothetical protein MTsPCn6_25690 [Croceitalea sp. MTPC6]GMN17121.1 hypothetical protein MTsPCn9_20570 [Croceitalea sp. MTPC9]